MRRRAVVLGAGALAVAGWWPGTAVAVDQALPGLTVSSDGLTWSSDLAAPLFDPATVWVPGDVRTAAFFVRNQGPVGVSVRVEARDAGTRRLTSSGDVVLFARTDAGAWHRLPPGADSERLNQAAVPAGGTSRVEVRAVFDAAAGDDSRLQQAALSFVVRLTDARFDALGGVPGHEATGSGDQAQPAGQDPGAQPPGGSSSGGLPSIGAPDVRLPVGLGALLVGTGFALVSRRRGARHG